MSEPERIENPNSAQALWRKWRDTKAAFDAPEIPDSTMTNILLGFVCDSLFFIATKLERWEQERNG